MARQLFRLLLIAALSFGSNLGALASQGSGCMPTTGTVSGLTLVQDINTGIAALISTNSGASAPATDCSAVAIKGQLWLDTTTSTAPILKIYSGSAWLALGTVDVTNGIWTPPVGGGTQSIVSATTTNLCTAPQSVVTITGTTTITSFGSSCSAGQSRDIKFSGALTLTYNASSMILPTAASITTAAGDYARAVYLGSGNWVIVAYTKADGTALATTAIFTGAVFYNSVISPTALGANTNNWNPTSLASSNTIRFSCSAAYNITGITAPATDGKLLLLDNIGASFPCTLTSQDTNSTAANRFALVTPVIIRPLQQVAVRYDITTARWKLWQESNANPIAGSYRNLRVYNAATAMGDSAPGTPNNQMFVKSDGMTLEDAFGDAKRLTTVSCTSLNITGSGANGLDTGSVSAPNWYAVWVIYNPTTDTTACMFSASSTLGTITLPSGYTFGVRVGWNYYVTNNAVTGLRRVIQYGNRAQYIVVSGSNTNTMPLLFSSTTGSGCTGGSPSYATQSVTTFVPTTAASIFYNISIGYNSGSEAIVLVAPNVSYSSQGTNVPYATASRTVNSWVNGPGSMLLEGTTIAACSSATGGAVNVAGWVDNL